MTEKSELAAGILAGGRATRLDGVNKGTLVVGSTAIVDRQLDALREVSREIFVVGRDDPAWTSRGLRVVADDRPGAGPLAGTSRCAQFTRAPVPTIFATGSIEGSTRPRGFRPVYG